jgi:TRAP transporter 4TM/12TM fusion protein
LGRFRWVFLLLIVLSLIPTLYIQFYSQELEFTTELGRASDFDVAMGIILLIAPLTACYFAFGIPIVAVACLFLAYLFLGQYIPIDVGGHGGYSLERIMIQLSIGLSSGIYGQFLQASLSYIFLLIVFGAILQVTGASDFFMDLAKFVGQRIRGGAAQTAVIGSALMGTVSGSPMANVAVTGAYTIPTMKSTGFRPMVAGAVEAAASTGGQIMPPIMGAAAFIMASVMGISSAKIMIIASIPAILYFFGVFSYIFFEAGRWKPSEWKVSIDRKETLLRAPLFIVPLGLLMYLLLAGYTVMFGAFWAIITVLLLSLIRKETRPSLKMLLNAITRGAEAGSGIAVTTSVLGMMTVIMTMTGLGLRIPDLLQMLSGGNLAFALFLGFVAAIILGCGLHTVAVYTIVALTVAPALIVAGIPKIAAHFFILYAGVFSNVTPPVAVAALVAAGIAGSRFLPTAFQALKIALPGFILPFAFIWCPAVLGDFSNPALDGLTILSLAACLFVVSASMAGYFIVRTNLLERLLLGVAAVGFLGFSFTYNFIFMVTALFLTVLVFLMQMSRKKKSALAIN